MIEDLLFISENLLRAAVTLDDLTAEERNYIISVATKAIKIVSIELKDEITRKLTV